MGTSKDFVKVSHHWRYFLPLQIRYIQAGYPDAEFVVTTNLNNTNAGKSDRLDKVVMPMLLAHGLVDHSGTFDLFNTEQNVWNINQNSLTAKLHSLGDL